MQDLISVIVISFNSEKTIIDTLNSVLSQTYSNIEMILSDDGSDDRTISVAKEWEIENNVTNLKIVSSKMNYGIPHNCNQGIKASSGKYIKIIAGDDLLYPDAIEKYYNEAKRHGDQKVIVQSKAEIFGCSKSNRQDYLNYSYESLRQYITLEQQKKKILTNNFLVAPAVGLIEKEIFLKVGLYDERYKGIEDYPFYCKLCMNGYRFVLLNEILVKWRVRDNSANVSPAMLSDLLKFFFDQKISYLMENKMYVEVVKQLKDNFFIIIKMKVKKMCRI